MDFEAIRSAVVLAHDSHFVSRINCGNSRIDAESKARSYALGMCKAFELAELLTEEEATKIMLSI